jgi:hypothetical protein
MKHIFIVFVIAILSSCMTAKKADKFLDKNPEFSAKQCADRFPIKETIDTLTVYDTTLIKAYEMEYGYLYHIIDSLLGKQVSDSTKKEIVTIFQEKKVPVIKYKYITKVQESTAKQQVIIDSCNKMSSLLNKKLEISNNELGVMTEKCDKYRSEKNRLWWILIILLLYIFRKPIIRLTRALVKPI